LEAYNEICIAACGVSYTAGPFAAIVLAKEIFRERQEMRLAMIGLGRMGGNMAQRLLHGGHEVIVYDRSAEAVTALVTKGVAAAKDVRDVAKQLEPRRIIWIMLPAGSPVDSTIEDIVPNLTRGDVIIDGGNSNFRDTLRRAEALESRGIDFVDVGTSGGIWGLTIGYCLMIGGTPEAFRHCEPIFRTLAPTEGYAHVGPPGAGHYVKMVHNGIEYGLLQAYAEGYEILHASQDFELDLGQIAKLWNRGSVVRSWLNELAESAFARDDELASIKGYVEDSGEGRWTVEEAIRLNVPAPVITLSLLARLRSRQEDSFGAKVIAALRQEFGGHAVKTKSD
jgi:6-phosphogluconate dehydrogenase